MRLTANELAREAAATGFQAEPLEKVIVLLELLEAIRSHPFLKDRIALKGGTALNLFKFDVPRLSVDIDLNYVGAMDREGILTDRPKIEQWFRNVWAFAHSRRLAASDIGLVTPPAAKLSGEEARQHSGKPMDQGFRECGSQLFRRNGIRSTSSKKSSRRRFLVRTPHVR